MLRGARALDTEGRSVLPLGQRVWFEVLSLQSLRMLIGMESAATGTEKTVFRCMTSARDKTKQNKIRKEAA